MRTCQRTCQQKEIILMILGVFNLWSKNIFEVINSSLCPKMKRRGIPWNNIIILREKITLFPILSFNRLNEKFREIVLCVLTNSCLLSNANLSEMTKGVIIRYKKKLFGISLLQGCNYQEDGHYTVWQLR